MEGEILNKIKNFGMLGYPPSKIIAILEINDEKTFIRDFYDHNSEICKAYQKGADQADHYIDNKLFEMAQKGDLNALRKFESRKRKNQNKMERERR